MVIGTCPRQTLRPESPMARLSVHIHKRQRQTAEMKGEVKGR